MRRVNKRKIGLLMGCVTVSLTSVLIWTTLAEEKESVSDRYIIIELSLITYQDADIQETELEASTEVQSEPEQQSEAIEAETVSDSAAILFSLEDSFNSDDYSIAGISVNEPVIAQLLSQTTDYKDYDSIALYDLVSHRQTADELYDFNLQIPEDAEVILYQTAGGKLQENTLDVLYAAEEYNRLPLISYESETNHWLIVYLGSGSMSDSDTEAVAIETESAVESLEGQVDGETVETDTTEPSKDVAKAFENGKTPEKQTSANVTEGTKAETKPASVKAPDTKPAQTVPTTAPLTVPATTKPTTTAHTHTWAAINSTIHHDAVTTQVWKEDSAAWDETVVIKAAWDENVLVQDAYDETVIAQEAYDEPVYGWGPDICNICGARIEDDPTGDKLGYHILVDPGCGGGWHSDWEQIGTNHHDAVYQTVHHEAVYNTVHHDAETTIVHHEAVGHYETVVTQEAWDETVVTGYTCSGCGATK